MDAKGATGRWDGLAEWDRHTHTAMYKTDNEWEQLQNILKI